MERSESATNDVGGNAFNLIGARSVDVNGHVRSCGGSTFCLEILRGGSMEPEYLCFVFGDAVVHVGERAKKWAKFASRRVFRVDGPTASCGTGQVVEVVTRSSFSAEVIQRSSIHRAGRAASYVAWSVVSSRRSPRSSARRVLALPTCNSNCFVAY